MYYKKHLGQKGENIALKHYQSLGFKLIKKNFYTRYGELDLVLTKNNKILVVEVKTRTSYHYGWGEESISSKKLANINKAYQILSQKNNLDNKYDLEICVVEIIDKKTTIKTFLV